MRESGSQSRQNWPLRSQTSRSFIKSLREKVELFWVQLAFIIARFFVMDSLVLWVK